MHSIPPPRPKGQEVALLKKAAVILKGGVGSYWGDLALGSSSHTAPDPDRGRGQDSARARLQEAHLVLPSLQPDV